jgi:serine/threonine protein kinase
LICVLAIEYFANYHSKNFFHGDIKPENILVSKRFELTSDAGTLLSLGEDLDKNIPRYLINQYTKSYASSEHIFAVENKIALSRN